MLGKHYKAVFIDLDDTIGDFHGTAYRSLGSIYDEFGLSRFFVSKDEYVGLYQPHNVELWERYGRGEISKEFLQQDRFAYPFYAKGIEAIELAKQTGDRFIYLTSVNYTAIDGAKEVVDYLKAKYPLTILSNGFKELQYKKLALIGMADAFQHVVLSEEVGVQKPDPRIFEYAMRLNGVSTAEVIMIGDSYSSDILGAQNAGIDQIWINTQDTNPTHSSTFRLSNILEVMNIL